MGFRSSNLSHALKQIKGTTAQFYHYHPYIFYCVCAVVNQLIMKTNKSTLEVGDKVGFHSGNCEGLTGTITKAENGKQFEPYGLKFTVELSNCKIGYIEKAEHWHFI